MAVSRRVFSQHYIADDRVSGDTIPRNHTDNVFVSKAENFIREHVAKRGGKPFFVDLPLHAVHGPLTPPDNLKEKAKTGLLGDMIMWVDQTVGRVTALLDELKLTEDTLFIFTSDNGSVHYPITPNLAIALAEIGEVTRPMPGTGGLMFPLLPAGLVTFQPGVRAANLSASST